MSTPAIKSVPRSGELDRDAEGYPEGLRNTGESRAPVNVSTITGGTVPVNAKVDQSHSGNINHHLPYLIFLACMATAATVLCIVGYIYGPPYVRAQIRAEFAQDIAEVRAQTQSAGTDAAIAKNTVQKLEARINERR